MQTQRADRRRKVVEWWVGEGIDDAERLPAAAPEQVLARHAAGKPAGYAPAALGVSAKRVYGLLRERGVLRSRSEARRMVRRRQHNG